MAKSVAVAPPPPVEQMTEEIVYLDPASILADDNSRFSLKKYRVDQLASSIASTGGVQVPIEVEPLEPPQDGFSYRLTAGFYRLAAVDLLNREQGAGLTIPAIIRPLPDPLTRLIHQLTENLERENQSPMDRAVAIKKLLDQGVTRAEVRNLFNAPGGRKGNVIQPLSNSMLNISLRLLELPKAIQQRIHEGMVGIAAAYELGKVPPDKRQAVLDEAEKDRLRQVAREEADEQKYLNAEAKFHETKAKESTIDEKIETLKDEIVKASNIVRDKMEEVKTAKSVPFLGMADVEKKDAQEKVKALETDLKGALKTQKDSQNELAKALGEKLKVSELADRKAAELEAARKAVKAPAKKLKAVSPAAVRKAAAEAAGNTGAVPLNVQDIRQGMKDVASVKDPTIAAIGKIFLQWVQGNGTPKLMIEDLETLLRPMIDSHTDAILAKSKASQATTAAAPVAGRVVTPSKAAAALKAGGKK